MTLLDVLSHSGNAIAVPALAWTLTMIATSHLRRPCPRCARAPLR